MNHSSRLSSPDDVSRRRFLAQATLGLTAVSSVAAQTASSSLAAARTPGEVTALLTKEEREFLGLHNHRTHATGPLQKLSRKQPAPKRGLPAYTVEADRAWLVMLHQKKLAPRATVARVLTALGDRKETKESAASMTFDDSEGWLKEYFVKQGVDSETAEDLASAANYGRTRQEPTSRMLVRDRLLDVEDALLHALEVTLDSAAAHVDTIMPGVTHMAHAQPTTYAGYLLAVYDALARCVPQLDLAYHQTNENTMGCGAVSGTGWPVDRELVTRLLGFGRLVEPTYGCEGAQDYALTAMFAMSNIAVALSRSAMDHAIWGMDDIGFITVPASLMGNSSLMPQKAHPGSTYEGLRTMTNRVIGHMTTGVVANKGEPLTDVIPIYLAWTEAADAAVEAEKALLRYSVLQRHVIVIKDRMLENVRAHFSCAPDLSVKLIREKGYGGRRAHRIAAVFVYMAKKAGLKPHETTGELLDEAARIAREKPPGISTAELQEIFDPVKFLERHNNVGDPNPAESRRLIDVRRRELAAARAQQAKKKTALGGAKAVLQREVRAIQQPA